MKWDLHGFYCTILSERLEHLQTSGGVRDQWPVGGTEHSSWASSHLSWPSLCLSAHVDSCAERGRDSTGSRLIPLSLACCHLCQDSLHVSTGRREGTEAMQAFWRPELGAATMSFCLTVLVNMCTPGDWLQCGGLCPLSQGSSGKSLVSERCIRVTSSQGMSLGGG